MIEYTRGEFKKIEKYFPRLQYRPDENLIIGTLDIAPCRYEKKEGKSSDEWEIMPCCTNTIGCITGEYQIQIDFNKSDDLNDHPQVKEVGEKIERLGYKLNKTARDLHLYPKSKVCCLSVYFCPAHSLSQFILHNVYPYFVWQASYYLYHEVPPCGEYSHEEKGIKEATEEYCKTMASSKKLGRNEKCPCGSGRKYKRCCLEKDNSKKQDIRRLRMKYQTNFEMVRPSNDVCRK